MKSSLVLKVSILVISMVSVGGGITAYLVYRSSSSALENAIGSNQLEVTKETMDKVDRFLYERQADIETATSRQQLKDFLSNDQNRTSIAVDQIRQNLQSLKTITAAWEEIGIYDKNGTLLSSTNVDETSPIDPQLFKQLIAGQVVHSDVHLDSETGRPTMLFMAPIRNGAANGQVIGGLIGELAWTTVLEILQGFSNQRAELLNSGGQSLGDNNLKGTESILKNSFAGTQAFKNAQKSSSGSMVLPGIDNPKAQFVTSYVKEGGYLDYTGNGWTLVLETPKSLAYKPASTLAEKLIITFLGVLILSVGAFLAILHLLVLRPISNLKEVIERLSQGDFSLRTSITSKDELGSLGQGFNDMADKMQTAYKSLREASEEAENEKRTLQTILDNLPVGVHVVKAPSGESVMLNRIGAELIGRGSLPGAARDGTYSEVFDIIKEDGSPYPKADLPMSITLKEGRTVFRDNIYVKRPNGIVIVLRAITAPIRFIDGSVRTAVGVFEDISTERELERSREEFFSIASHELRTPLTAIRGNTSLIHQYYWDKLPDSDIREMIDDIHESSVRLIEIVNDFLDTSRLEQKRMKFEVTSFDIVKMAESVIKEYQVTSSRQKIHLEIKHPEAVLPLVWADMNRSKQVLINLVGNALKFTENGSVTISFMPTEGFVKVLITDTGKGISLEAQRLLFKKFEQTGSTVLTRDSVRGTGLGLYISKLLTEQMHGAINLEASTPGVGTVFSFSLPITPPMPLEEDDSTSTAVQATKAPGA